jgi:hypothetical protein
LIPADGSVRISQVKGRGNRNVSTYEPGVYEGLDDRYTCAVIRDLAVISSLFLLTGSAEKSEEGLQRLLQVMDIAASVQQFLDPVHVSDGDDPEGDGEEEEHDEDWHDRFPPVLACENCGNDLEYEIGVYADVGRRIDITMPDGPDSLYVNVHGGDPYDWDLSDVKMECHHCGHEWDFPRGAIDVR